MAPVKDNLIQGSPPSSTSAAAGLSSLPELVRAYVERSAPAGVSAGGTARIRQRGEMVLKPGARPRRFTASEEFAIDRVSFAWRARFPMLGPIGLNVTDSYDSGDGLLQVNVLGIPIQRQQGAELARGEAFRYLAEIPWVPQAILANRELQWRQLDERTVEVAAEVGQERAAVQLSFNEAGEIWQTVADRPRAEAGNALTRWVGSYGDYQDFGGVRVPTRGEVRWELPDGPFVYWRGTVSAFETDSHTTTNK